MRTAYSQSTSRHGFHSDIWRISLRFSLVAIGLLVLLGLLLLTGNAKAEKLIADLSSPEVRIASNFTGTEIVVFGAIERDAASVPRTGTSDVVVVLIGPSENVVTRRKERMLGIWVNKENRTFVNVPSFYALHSSRDLIALSNDPLLTKFEIGLNHLVLPAKLPADALYESGTKEFREALLRLKQSNGLYAERPGAVSFLSPTLFRTTIPLPANVPVGTYEVQVYLIQDGAMLSKVSSKLKIAKTGFEQYTYSLAHNYSLAYGLAAVVLALFTGWLAGVIFRKD